MDATKIKRLKSENLRWIHDLRLKKECIVEVLVDPWSVQSAIWELNISTFEIHKIKDFTDYQEKEYSEAVDW